MRKRRSQDLLSVVMNFTVKVFALVFFPLVALYSLLDKASLRKRNARFAGDVADAYVALISKYEGVVSPGLVAERGGSFDYVEASLEFPDRTLRFVCGRGELTISCNGSSAFSGEAGELFRSAMFIEEHWNDLLEADYNAIQGWLRTDA